MQECFHPPGLVMTHSANDHQSLFVRLVSDFHLAVLVVLLLLSYSTCDLFSFHIKPAAPALSAYLILVARPV